MATPPGIVPAVLRPAEAALSARPEGNGRNETDTVEVPVGTMIAFRNGTWCDMKATSKDVTAQLAVVYEELSSAGKPLSLVGLKDSDGTSLMVHAPDILAIVPLTDDARADRGRRRFDMFNFDSPPAGEGTNVR